jgi:hypothetical protein
LPHRKSLNLAENGGRKFAFELSDFGLGDLSAHPDLTAATLHCERRLAQSFQLARWFVRIQLCANFFAGPEVGMRLAFDGDERAASRVAPHPCFAVPDSEGAETPQLNPFTASHRVSDSVEHCVDYPLHVTVIEMRIFRPN